MKMDLSIAKEKYNNITKIKNKVSIEKWIEFIELNKDYYTWVEETDAGKYRLENLDEIPESFREGIIKGHHKSRAMAEFNVKKGYYEIVVDEIGEYGHIATTFMKRIKKNHLQRLLEMAKYLDALLLNHGNKIIDQKFIDEMK